MQKILLYLSLSFFPSLLYAQNNDKCENTDFEYGDFTNWEGRTGYCCGDGINTPGIVDGRHTIMSSIGTDPYTNNLITYLAPGGGKYSVRLGNNNVGREAESIRRSFLVTADNASFTYQYALVLQDPEGHEQNDKPKFEVKLYDENDSLIPGPCGYYQVTAGPATNNWSKNGDIRYIDWRTVGVDLSAYLNKTITIEFSTEDCGLGGHFGYAYIDASCGLLKIIVSGYCDDNDTVTLTAPPNFKEYKWAPGGQTTRVIKILKPQEGDSVRVYLTNEAGCTTSILYIFQRLPLPVAKAGKDTTICYGQKVILKGSSLNFDDKFTWTSSPPGFFSEERNPVVQPGVTTTYYLQTKNTNGCSGPLSFDSVKINVVLSAAFELGNDTTICKGNGLEIKGPDKPAAIFSWVSKPAGFTSSQSQINVSPVQTTTYILTVTDSACSYTDSITIAIYEDLKTKNPYNVQFCEGDTVFVLTAPANYEYSWDTIPKNNSSTLTIKNPKDSMNVRVFLFSIYGCPDTMVFRLLKQKAPAVKLGNDTSICLGEDLLIIPLQDSGAAAYSWTSNPPGFSSGLRTISVFPDSNTTYILRITDSLGCSDFSSVDSIRVNILGGPRITLPPYIAICKGDSVTLASSTGSGKFSWTSDPPGFSSTDSSITVKPEEKTTYYLHITNDTCGTIGYTVVDVHEITSYSQPVKYCEGDTLVTLIAPDGYKAYQWIAGGQITTSINIKNPSAGSVYIVLLTPNAGENCKDTVRFILNELPSPVANAGTDTSVCYGRFLKLDAANIGNGGFYQWTSIPSGYYSNQRSPIIRAVKTTRYVLTVTNTFGCSGPESVDTIEVKVDSTAIPNLGTDKSICFGDSITLSSSTGTGDYDWFSFPQGEYPQTPKITVHPKVNTRYIVRISNATCFAFDTITIFVPPPPVMGLPSNFDICKGQDTFLTATQLPGAAYQWESKPAGFQSALRSPEIKPEITTLYTLKLTNLAGCIFYDSVLVTVHVFPKPNLQDFIKLCKGDSMELDAGEAISYKWSTEETTRKITVKEAGLYEVEASNGSCTAKDMIKVELYPDDKEFFAPNIFTPNDDGKNEKFEITLNNTTEYNLKIYSRWGQKVFETTDPQTWWDGKVDFSDAKEGVYFWVMQYRRICDPNNLVKKDGNLTLMK